VSCADAKSQANNVISCNQANAFRLVQMNQSGPVDFNDVDIGRRRQGCNAIREPLNSARNPFAPAVTSRDQPLGAAPKYRVQLMAGF
jgi:hypothetical protein